MANGNDLNWAGYSPRVMAQSCSRCGTPPNTRCRGPRGEVNAHQARLIAAGYVYDRETKKWRSEQPKSESSPALAEP